MYKALRNASVLATGAAGAVACFHEFQKHYIYRNYTVYAETRDNDNVPKQQNSPDLDLELKQVQVFFRHGARTPIHVLEGYRQVPYDVDLVMRPHHHTLFPHERVLLSTGLPCDWSPYEHRLRHKNLLCGESIPGHLTGLGQEQMYRLGLRIRAAYRDQLELSTFDPSALFILSTNITRTVESARCVIAGMYGNEQLKSHASQHGPVKIPVCDRSNNILIPDTESCSVLRKVSHASILHFDFVSSMKMDREMVEKHIDDSHDLQQDALTKAQNKINKVLDNKQRAASTTVAFNSDRQPYTHNEKLYEAVRERDQVINDISHFWHNAITHHPAFAKRLPKDELRVLLSLRQIEVEEFNLKFKSGYRFRFHFDSNAYFHNRVICKEVTKMADGTLSSSNGTEIKWKKGKIVDTRNVQASGDENDKGDGISFFSWLSEQNLGDHDKVGDDLKALWQNPVEFYKHVSYKMDHSTMKKINFVLLYDDLTARVTHGWWCPEGLGQFEKMTQKNGARMMFYAMTGRHKRERPTVTSLAIGRLLKDMVERAEAMMKGENTQQFCLYSSHDSTMVAVLESLGLWRHTWPPFGSDLRLEIYQDRKSSDYYVKVLYIGQPEKLRGQNEHLIRWEEFRRVVEPYMMNMETFEKICASNFLEQVAKDVLEHEEGEITEGKKFKKISETPAGM